METGLKYLTETAGDVSVAIGKTSLAYGKPGYGFLGKQLIRDVFPASSMEMGSQGVSIPIKCTHCNQ